MPNSSPRCPAPNDPANRPSGAPQAVPRRPLLPRGFLAAPARPLRPDAGPPRLYRQRPGHQSLVEARRLLPDRFPGGRQSHRRPPRRLAVPRRRRADSARARASRSRAPTAPCPTSTISTICSAKPAATTFASCSRSTQRAPSADLSGVARFWLSRGVAGLYIATPPGTPPNRPRPSSKRCACQPRERSAGASSSPTLTSLRPASANDAQPAGPLDPASRVPPSRRERRSRSRAAADRLALQPPSHSERGPASPVAGRRPSRNPNLLLDVPRRTSDPRSLAPRRRHHHADDSSAALIDAAANLNLEPTPDQSSVPSRPTNRPSPRPLLRRSAARRPTIPSSRTSRRLDPSRDWWPRTRQSPPDPLTTWYQRLAGAASRQRRSSLPEQDLSRLRCAECAGLGQSPGDFSPQTPPVVVICNLSSSPPSFRSRMP